MDCIRTIESSATDAELGDWLFGHKTARLYFGRRPRQSEVGDLMFISFQGRVIAVATIAEMDDDPDSEGLYWITLRSVRRLAEKNLDYRGYASVKYVDRLPDQFDGMYAKLANRLSKISKEYRATAKGATPQSLNKRVGAWP